MNNRLLKVFAWGGRGRKDYMSDQETNDEVRVSLKDTLAELDAGGVVNLSADLKRTDFMAPGYNPRTATMSVRFEDLDPAWSWLSNAYTLSLVEDGTAEEVSDCDENGRGDIPWSMLETRNEDNTELVFRRND